MFTTKLYDHKYDIDDLINAFCGENSNGRWILNSRNGDVFCEHKDADTASLEDGADENHWHVIEPLPYSFVSEIYRNSAYKKLTETEQNNIDIILKSIDCMQNLNKGLKNQSEPDSMMAAGFIRERLKDAVLEWLDMKNMIPPSMRHVRDVSMYNKVENTPSKVQIQLEEN